MPTNARRMLRRPLSILVLAALVAAPALARSPVPVGTFASGPHDGIVDVPGVRVGHVTKISGDGALVPGRGPVRTGATGIIPNADTWDDRVAAATYDLNGNGELTGAHWVNQAGFLETPIVLTDTLDVGRADDGVVSWMIKQHPQIGVRDDVPLPVVAECDDQGINDMQGRHVGPADIVAMLDGASQNDFARGSVGAGTGMRAFDFKAGIGSASRVLPASLGGYTVGILLNANTGRRAELRVAGVPVGAALARDLLPQRAALAPGRGRAADGSVIVVLATDAPLDGARLRDLLKRVVLGLGRVGVTSHTSSGDLFIGFSTTHRFPRRGGIAGPALVTDDARIDALFAATADATEAAMYDALFSARTMTGANGLTYYGLPFERVAPMLRHER